MTVIDPTGQLMHIPRLATQYVSTLNECYRIALNHAA